MTDRPSHPKPAQRRNSHGSKPPFKKDGSKKGGSRPSDKRSSEPRQERPFKEIPLTSAQLTRQLAASAVRNVRTDGLPLEAVLAALPEYNGLEPRDRAFVRLIAATTFRRWGQIKAVYKPLIRKEPPAFIRATLETAAAQILFLGTPPHAAVGETVGMLKANKATRGFANLANAVLRKVVEEGPKLAGAEAPRANIPGWIRGSWERSYGRASVRKMALQYMKEPPLDLTLKNMSEPNTNLWAEKLGAKVVMPGTVRLSSIGNVASLEGYAEGDWWAQDIAATLPVRALLNHMGDLSGKTILDLCAAPGGKTLQLASLGAKVTALDKSEQRLSRVNENLKRTKLDATIVCADATEWENDEKFDVVLLDAPCTATGTFRRHPDVLHNRTPKTLSQLVRLQDKLLPKAASLLKPGGVLVFATCSLQEEEGEPRIARLIRELPDFRRIPVLLSSLSDISGIVTENESIRTFPYGLDEIGGMDGFFVAILQRSTEIDA
jgi:16S rRNA (cytosine967-C5)-methyltransferase